MVQIIPIILVLAIYIVIPITLVWYLFLKNKASISEKWIWMIIILITNYIGVLGYYIYVSNKKK
jgi:hypothetical protein